MNHHHRIMIITLIKKILRDDIKDVLEMILRFSTNLFFFFNVCTNRLSSAINCLANAKTSHMDELLIAGQVTGQFSEIVRDVD